MNSSLQDAYEGAKNQIANLKKELEDLKKEKSENIENLMFIEPEDEIEPISNESEEITLPKLDQIKKIRSNDEVFKLGWKIFKVVWDHLKLVISKSVNFITFEVIFTVKGHL